MWVLLLCRSIKIYRRYSKKKFMITMVMAMLLLIATAAPAFAGGHGQPGRATGRGNVACDMIPGAASAGLAMAGGHLVALDCD